MPRSLSVTFIETLQALETGDTAIFLITFSHASWGTPIRIVNNKVDVTSGGNLYNAMAFDITLGADDSKSVPQMSLTIDNVDRSIIQEIRTLDSPPDISVKLALASAPDTIEIDFPDMKVSGASYDAATIRTSVVVSETLNLKYPRGSATPQSNPGLF